jgi:hypothetical protein
VSFYCNIELKGDLRKMKIIVELRITLLVIALILFFNRLECQENKANELLNFFNKNYSSYTSKAFDMLHYFTSKDSILKIFLYQNDSAKLKALECKLTPRLYLKDKAKDFKCGENISDYFDIDSNKLEIFEAIFYVNDTIYFKISRIRDEYDISEYFDPCPNGSILDEKIGYHFNQCIYYLYKDKIIKNKDFSKYTENIENLFLRFEIKGLSTFIINNSKIEKVLFFDGKNDFKYDLESDKMNKVFCYDRDWVIYVCKNAKIKKNIFNFWNWNIFKSIPPKPYSDEGEHTDRPCC